MISSETKEISLSPINPTQKDIFTLATVAGRDAIAEQIERDIDEYSVQAFSDGPRTHLGASVIGHNCERYIWFHFRWMKFEKFSGKMMRLFNRGHLEEDRIISWLRGIGFEVQQTDVDGKQIRIAAHNGHFGGSCDGIGMLPQRYFNEVKPPLPGPYTLLLEFKTANDKQFQEIKNTGVMKAKPRHYKQMCVYGVKLGIKYGLYICNCKNDDDIDVELLELDWSLGEAEMAKAERIITATIPPPRISETASYYECKYCPMNDICHLGAMPEKNCRSCSNSEPREEKSWYCNHYRSIIPAEYIAAGCDAWQPLPR